MAIRGVRGATVCEKDHPDAIYAATREMLSAIMQANPGLQPEDIASALFTVTSDLQSAYPAKAARELGWSYVPLMCANEIPVPDELERCIRVLLLWNTEVEQTSIQHVYLKEAASLRPDLAKKI